MTTRPETPQHYAYILRFWETRSRPPDPPATWRFSLENLHREEQHKFPDLKSLTDFLEDRVGSSTEELAAEGLEGVVGAAPADNGRGAAGMREEEAGSIETSILLVEEDEAIRKRMAFWLDDILPNCAVLEAGQDEEAVGLARSESPGVILVDIAPPKVGGIETIKELRSAAPGAKIVALTMGEGGADGDAVLSAGANASLRIWEVQEKLLPTLRDVLTGEEESGEERTVVCIEDELDMISLIQFALARHQVKIVGALGGKEGLDVVRQVKPDLVLLDLMMPDVDGWQVYQRMKADEELRDIPVIVITVLDPYWSAKQGLDLTGVDGYVTKPFVVQELAERVHDTLRLVA